MLLEKCTCNYCLCPAIIERIDPYMDSPLFIDKKFTYWLNHRKQFSSSVLSEYPVFLCEQCHQALKDCGSAVLEVYSKKIEDQMKMRDPA